MIIKALSILERVGVTYQSLALFSYRNELCSVLKIMFSALDQRGWGWTGFIQCHHRRTSCQGFYERVGFCSPSLTMQAPVGNPALRKMSFHERGCDAAFTGTLYLREHLDEFYQVSYQTGATKADSWVDIEGGIGNLFSYASLRRKFPDTPYCLDGENHPLGKANTFMGHHLLIP
jgi:hypothetical protein